MRRSPVLALAMLALLAGGVVWAATYHTITVDAHDHKVKLDHAHGELTTSAAGAHGHVWATYEQANSWTSGDGVDIQEAITTLTNGAGTAAPLNVPATAQVTLNTSQEVDHTHTVAVPPLVATRTTSSHPETTLTSTGAGAHSHSATVKVPGVGADVDSGPAIGPLANTKAAPTLPPFVGLLKLIRIR